MPVQTRSSTKKHLGCSIATDENHWVTDSDDGTNDSEIRLITRDVCEIKNPPKYDVNIDFDNASRAWRSNKRRDGEGWVYKIKIERSPKKKTSLVVTLSSNTKLDNPRKPLAYSGTTTSSFSVNSFSVAKTLFTQSIVTRSIAKSMASSISSRVKENRRGGDKKLHTSGH